MIEQIRSKVDNFIIEMFDNGFKTFKQVFMVKLIESLDVYL